MKPSPLCLENPSMLFDTISGSGLQLKTMNSERMVVLLVGRQSIYC